MSDTVKAEIKKEVKKELNKAPQNRPRNMNSNNGNNNFTEIQKMKDQVSKLRQQSTQLRNELRDANRTVKAVKTFKRNPYVSKAAAPVATEDSVRLMSDAPTSSKFLRSLLVPEDGPASIPDAVMRLHAVRSETVTYNIGMINGGVASVSGLLILYPNHPTSLIGYNYIFSPDFATATCTQKLTTAQQLSESYDYGRRTSQLLTIRSSTLPSGMYAINGTFNAIRVDGTLSELTLDPANLYNSILASTTNIMDKAGNVSVGDGISVLSIPDSFSVPYTRLNDATPTAGTGTVIATNKIIDVSQDLNYEISFTSTTTQPAGPLAGVVIASLLANFDSSDGMYINATIQVTVPVVATTVPMAVLLNVEALDPFGNVLGNIVVGPQTWTQSATSSTAISSTFSAFLTDELIVLDGPIAAVNIFFNFTAGGGFVAGNVTTIGQVTLTAPLGARPGINTPMVLVPYESVANGSTITVAGISNFELIPNPELRRNLPTDYCNFDPEEMQAVEAVIANRFKYDIRSVWNSVEYAHMVPAFRALADPSQHHLLSESLGWSDIARFLRNKIAPAAGALLKGVNPALAPLVDSGLQLISKSASGRVVSRAMTTQLSRPTVRRVLPRPITRVARRPIQPRVSSGSKFDRVVAFPTVTVDENDQEVGEGLYVVVSGKRLDLLPASAAATSTFDGHTVYGLIRSGGVLFATGSDLTMFMVDPCEYRQGRIVPVANPPPLEGHSCDGAMWLMANTEFTGIYPAAITGEVKNLDGRPILQSTPVYPEKARYLHAFGIPLIANDPRADLDVSNLIVLKKKPVIKLTRKVPKRAVARACSPISDCLVARSVSAGLTDLPRRAKTYLEALLSLPPSCESVDCMSLDSDEDDDYPRGQFARDYLRSVAAGETDVARSFLPSPVETATAEEGLTTPKKFSVYMTRAEAESLGLLESLAAFDDDDTDDEDTAVYQYRFTGRCRAHTHWKYCKLECGSDGLATFQPQFNCWVNLADPFDLKDPFVALIRSSVMQIITSMFVSHKHRTNVFACAHSICGALRLQVAVSTSTRVRLMSLIYDLVFLVRSELEAIIPTAAL